MEVYAVLSEKGGVGKSISARNMAKGFADAKKRTLLIDNDPQANTTTAQDPSTRSIGDLCENLQAKNEKELLNALSEFAVERIDLSDLYLDDSKVQEAIIKTEILNLDLIPCSLELSNTEKKILADPTRSQQDRMKRVLRRVRNNYDIVIIDCAPTLNLLTINALFASDQVLIPVKIDEGGLQGFAMTAQLIHQLKENFNLDIDYKVVFTMVQKTRCGWLKECQKIIDLFNECIPDKTCKTVIRNQAKETIKTSFEKGFVIDSQTGVGKDYRSLVEELGGNNHE